jgi:ribosome-binding factor A
MNPDRQSKIMTKLIGTHKEKKKFYGATESSERKMPILASPSSLSNQAGASKSTIRRVHVLNKLFMRNITDLMATSEFSGEIQGKGLQISRVKITQDFRGVHVYWLSQGTDEDENLEVILKAISGKLRHELSQLRLMGEVPKIFFLKDKQYAKYAEVDGLLSKADFGDDYTPTDPSYRLKSDFQLEYHLSSAIREQIKAMGEDGEDRLDEEPMPVMQNNVLGLDQESIMKRIKGTAKKTEEAWRNYEIAANSVESSSPEDIQKQVDAMTEKEKEFSKFLQQRTYIKKDKTNKNMLNKITLDYLRDDKRDKVQQEEMRFETDDVDYIVESTEDDKSMK